MAAPHNLPAELTTFIGREREIAQVSEFLSRTRLLTLTGAGGSGKSRLALHVATAVLEDFPDGAWIVELASLADPALVPQGVASALSVPEQPGRAPADTLVEALRPRSLLLVLDNCEHLRQACAQLAGALLRGCSGLRILATSRTPLSAPGETLWRVPSLSLPRGGAEPIDEIRRSEAVRLFVERARAAGAVFALTGGNAAAVVKLCQRLDGMPLAIELAAARAKVLSAEQIAARLDDRFQLLTGGTTAALPRHQTLRATMDWSFSFLAERERTLLRRSSVFAGGWTLEAAEAICSGQGVEATEVLDSLSRLVDNSLVAAETQHGAARYRMLETVRQYGQDRLREAGEADAVQRRHRDWYLELAERADPRLRGPEEDAWLGRLEVEHDNLRAALEWSKGERDSAGAELRLAKTLEWFWYLNGHWSEGRVRLENAIARSDEASPFLPKVLFGAARLAYRQGDGERARMLCERGLELSRAHDDQPDIIPLLMLSGIFAMVDAGYERATELFTNSLAVSRQQGDKWWSAEALAFLGTVAGIRGDNSGAAARCSESLTLAKETGSTNAITFALRNLGLLALRQGRYEQAAAYYRESLMRCREARTPGVITECLEGLAWAASARADYKRAARLLGAVEASFQALGGGQFSLYFDQSEHARYVASTRAGLGAAAFEAAWGEGWAMLLEQAVEFALTTRTDAPTPARAGNDGAAHEKPSPLTVREREVAALVAQGMTNREIAAALVVTERTAETHVQNILNKLGFGTRAQVAAWAVEQGLTKPRTRQ